MKLIIEGKPIPLQRARKGKYGFYDPQAKEKTEVFAKSIDQLGDFIILGPIVSVHYCFYMPIPKSFSKLKKAAYENRVHIKKPDLTNLQKFYEDVFNEILWKDDANIYYTVALKKYSANPRVEIDVTYSHNEDL